MRNAYVPVSLKYKTLQVQAHVHTTHLVHVSDKYILVINHVNWPFGMTHHQAEKGNWPQNWNGR